MRMMRGILAGLATMLPVAAAAQYEAPANPPDPAAHIAEMAALYDQICLTAFPDADAVARAVAERGAVPLSPQEVQAYLHDDPGRGWRIAGAAARFDVTIEDPPYHACGVRTMTAAGFPDLAPYRALADRYEEGKNFQRIDTVTMNLGSVVSSGGGEGRMLGAGTETLLVFNTTPSEGNRGNGQTAVEVRFVRQLRQGRR
jgi:hypothetical protein